MRQANGELRPFYAGCGEKWTCPLLVDACQRAAGSGQAVDFALDSGSSTSGGAWCGLIRASITRRPVQPQCFLSMNDPIPSMSAAGFERVKVTQRKLRSFRAVNSLSSTITISGKPRMESSVSNDVQKRAISLRAIADTAGPGRPGCRAARREDRETARGRRNPTGSSVASVRRDGPAAAITTFDPWFKPVPRVVERVDRRPGLEVQVGSPVDALEQVPEEARDVVDVERRVVFARDDQQVLGQRELPLAEDRVGGGQNLLRAPHRRIGHVPLAGDGQKQRMNAGRVDGVDGVDAGEDAGDDRAGQLVDQVAERRVFLRRPADRRERPDGSVAVVNALDRAARENRAGGCNSRGGRQTVPRACVRGDRSSRR